MRFPKDEVDFPSGNGRRGMERALRVLQVVKFEPGAWRGEGGRDREKDQITFKKNPISPNYWHHIQNPSVRSPPGVRVHATKCSARRSYWTSAVTACRRPSKVKASASTSPCGTPSSKCSANTAATLEGARRPRHMTQFAPKPKPPILPSFRCGRFFLPLQLHAPALAPGAAGVARRPVGGTHRVPIRHHVGERGKRFGDPKTSQVLLKHSIRQHPPPPIET